MSAKSVRNAIIGLIVLGGGLWFLSRVGKAFLPKDSPLDFSYIFTAVEGLLNLFLIGIALLIIILIPVWIAKKRSEKEEEQRKNQPVPIPAAA